MIQSGGLMTSLSGKKRRAISMVVAVLFFIGSVVFVRPQIVGYASTAEELAAELEELSESLAESKEELAELEAQVETEEQEQEYLESEIDTLTLQIDVTVATIAQVQEEINVTQTAIQEKIEEINTKQTEYDAEMALFGQRLAAMQELNDGGAMAILSTVQNLYQLLTFDQTMQDISDKNAEMLYDLETQRISLETAKTELEETQAKLEEQYATLDGQYASLESTKASIYSNYVAITNSIEAAEAAQAELEAQIEVDTIKYNEVESAIQDLIENSGSDYGDLNFSGGFIYPLASGTYYISQYYSASSHPAIDFAAPEYTPIYATASGYVTAAQWNSGGYGYYVLIYHGEMEGNTFSSLYAHMVQAPSVSVGDYVTQGQLIGYVGNTGNSFGNHLHYELWANSSESNSVANKAQRVNPLDYY